MRVEKLRPVAISAVVHAALVAWVAARAFAPVPVTDAATLTPIEIVTVAPAAAPAVPLDVVLDDRPPPEQAPATRSPAARPTARTDASAEHAAEIAATAGTPATETAPPRDSLLHMRRGEAPRLALPGGRWDDLDHVPAGTAPEKSRTSGILHDAAGGGRSSDQGVFTGKVAPDGSVELSDKRNFNVHLALPTAKSLGRALGAWYESDKGPLGRAGDTAMGKQIQVTTGSPVDDDGKPEHHLKDTATTVIIPVIGGGFDVTDWLMRGRTGDPYASKKLAFLDATRDERVALGNEHRKRQLALTPQIVQRNLAALWRATPDAQARKQALFAMWDECAETGDPAVVAGGEAARRMVIGFIRARLPAGSPDAYTRDELAALARVKQSKAAFEPYE